MTYKVVIVDDEPIMRKALQTLIDWRAINCEIVHISENGQEVLRYLENNKADILITDIKMPGVDGIELSKYIWENKLSTKVILLTAYADFSYAQSAVRYDVVEYVTKTGAFDELIQAVERCKTLLNEKKYFVLEDTSSRIEKFFRGVYDGNIYDKISEQFEQLNLDVENYVVVFFKFLMNENSERSKIVKLYDSLQNFFQSAFADHVFHGMFYKKDMYGLVLKYSVKEELAKKHIEDTCLKVIDMMDNFMELCVYIGVGEMHEEIEELSEAYEEAQAALNHSCLDRSNKLYFYIDEMRKEMFPVVSYDVKQQLVKECMEYIEEHFQETMSVSDISREVGTSISYLSRIFKESTGETIIRTINNKRIEKAKAYLKETDMKVYEVADILGFENVTYFSRFFKKHTGVSPKEFKEENKK